jgi:addiction module HigA family antidote
MLNRVRFLALTALVVVFLITAAAALGVSRKTLSAILNGRAGISPEMAIRLSLAFNTTAESWLNLQVQYDLWHADRNRKNLHVRTLVAA